MKNVSIIGNLTADVELKKSESGTEFARFNVAVNSGKGDKKTVTYFTCTAFSGMGKAIAQYCKKGNRVYIAGDLSAGVYKDKEVNYKPSLNVTVQNVEFLTEKEKEPTMEPPLDIPSV